MSRKRELLFYRFSKLKGLTEDKYALNNTNSGGYRVLKKSLINNKSKASIFADIYIYIRRAESLPESFELYERAIGALSTGVIFSSFSLATGLFDESILSQLGVVLVGCFCGPIILANANLRYQRYKSRKFDQSATDVIDFLLLGVDTGLSIDKALLQSSVAMRELKPWMSRELELTSKELAVLPEREQAFENLIQRTGSSIFSTLKAHIVYGEKHGTAIGASLRAVAAEARQNALMVEQEKARKLPVYLSIPVMFLILPPVIIISAGPSIVQLSRSIP